MIEAKVLKIESKSMGSYTKMLHKVSFRITHDDSTILIQGRRAISIDTRPPTLTIIERGRRARVGDPRRRAREHWSRVAIRETRLGTTDGAALRRCRRARPSLRDLRRRVRGCPVRQSQIARRSLILSSLQDGHFLSEAQGRRASRKPVTRPDRACLRRRQSCLNMPLTRPPVVGEVRHNLPNAWSTSK